MNAKQLEQPVFQAGPSRCKSDHGCHFCPRSSDRLERRSAKAEVAGAIPVVDTISALVPQQPQGGFRKPVFVGASPTKGSSLIQDRGVTVASLPVKETVRVQLPAS